MPQPDTQSSRQIINPRQYLKYTGLALATVAGAAVMVVELGVARVLTPVFGGSITVWAIVIATTMLALALGYAVGGYLADRLGGLRVAAHAAIIGALLCTMIPFLRITVIAATIDLSTLVGATVGALLLIAPALFFFSQVSPALIRGLAADGVSHVGVTAGGVYAVSTLGSLVGTLGAVWLFLYMPITLGFIGISLLVVLPALIIRPLAGGVALLLIGSVFAFQLMVTGPEQISGTNARGNYCEVLYKGHSPYGELRVIEEGGRFRYMVVNGSDQGGLDLLDGSSAYRYDAGLIALGDYYVRQPQSALIIGLGAGIMVKQLAEAGVDVVVAEIDPEVVRLAREYFDFQGEAVAADGRRYLQRSDRKWDIIFVDAYLGSSPPWHLYTREAFELYRDSLSAGGAVIINFIGSHLDSEQVGALAAVVTTAREVFPVVDAYPDPLEPDDYPTRNIYIAAADHPRIEPGHTGEPRQAPSLGEAIARMQPIPVVKGVTLSDDAAPLEPLVWRTTEYLRYQTGDYLPVNVLYH
jgi:spermidine synthase